VPELKYLRTSYLSMKNSLISLGAALASMACGLSFAALSAPAALTIHTAIEVEFGTETGRIYQLQGSSNLVDWTGIGDAVFGNGRAVSRVFSTRTGDEVAFQSYRLDVGDVPTHGLAPGSLAGVTLSLDDQPGRDRMRFVSETEGVDEGVQPDPFTYVFSRVDLNTVTADIRVASDKRDLLTLTFTAPGMGTWVREEYRKEKLKDRDTGVFSVLSDNGSGPGTGGTNTPPVVPVDMPSALAGLAYVFESGCGPVRLEFNSAGTGIEVGDDVNDDEPNGFTYQFATTGTNTASLVITRKPGRYDEYDLTFASGAQGAFVRREYRDGALRDTDRGSFSSAGGVPVNPPAGTGTMPTGTLSGLSYVMSGGESPDRLVFASATTGTEYSDDVDDTEPNTFTYTYSVTGSSNASLVVRFKADRWDEYDLTFLDGNLGGFVRREFQKNVLKDTDTGIFSGSPSVN